MSLVVLRPLSNNTKASSQCVNCLIFIHTITTALSDWPLNIFTWQLYSHKSHSVISYYSNIQQGVDTHPCLVTIHRLFTDTGQEVSAPNVSKHNRHQLSHQLSVVIASTLYPAPDTIVSLALYRISESNRRGHCSVGSANDQVVHMVIDYVAFPCVDDVGNRGEREESSSSSDAFAQFFTLC